MTADLIITNGRVLTMDPAHPRAEAVAIRAGRILAAGPRAEVEALGAEIKLGSIYEGKVISIKDFGCFVELAPGTDGMCHVSELAHGFVKTVSEVVKIGDVIKVKVINVDDSGRIKLSRKALMERPAGSEGDEGGERRDRGDRGDRGKNRDDKRPQRDSLLDTELAHGVLGIVNA